MVRLKELTNMVLEVHISEFQFLMVRLKAISNLLSMSITSISIPYGAIKSRLARSKSRCTQNISIPYGAIKSKRERNKK